MSLREQAVHASVGPRLCDDSIGEQAPTFILDHAARERVESCAVESDQPFGSLVSLRWIRSYSSGVTSAIAVGKGTAEVGAKAYSSTRPVATVAALASSSLRSLMNRVSEELKHGIEQGRPHQRKAAAMTDDAALGHRASRSSPASPSWTFISRSRGIVVGPFVDGAPGVPSLFEGWE